MKNCKKCNNSGWFTTWQFPYKNGLLCPALSQDNKEYAELSLTKIPKSYPANGRKISIPCRRCNNSAMPRIDWTGPLYSEELSSDINKNDGL
jgi:hypothetical protein